MQDELLTPKQGAESAQVHEYTVRRWLYRGELPFVKIGRATRIRRSDLEKFITPGQPAAEKAKGQREARKGRDKE